MCGKPFLALFSAFWSFHEKKNLTEARKGNPPTSTESLMPTEAGQRGAFGFNSDCIVKALRNRSVMREDQEGRER